jgi:receptor protein-tyrosine kinase
MFSSLFEGESQPGDLTAPEPIVRPVDLPAVAKAPEPLPIQQPIPHQIRTLPVRLNSASPLLPFDDAQSAAAEQYRIIRTRLIQHPKQPRMLLISSAGPADGKTITAVNMAGALSLKSDAKVLLADTDFRRSTIHTQLGIEVEPGLTDVLSGAASLEEALIRCEQFPNLYIIPAGSPRSNPSELLDSANWTIICDRLRKMFRYVIADSPPVASVADYELLQAACDGVVLVARPDKTSRMGLFKALEVVPEAKLIGVVMNCVPDWFLGRNYYYAPYYYGTGRK